jgi:hypothetical protein
MTRYTAGPHICDEHCDPERDRHSVLTYRVDDDLENARYIAEHDARERGYRVLGVAIDRTLPTLAEYRASDPAAEAFWERNHERVYANGMTADDYIIGLRVLIEPDPDWLGPYEITMQCPHCDAWVSVALDDCDQCGKRLLEVPGVEFADRTCHECGGAARYPVDEPDDMILCSACVHALVWGDA